MRLEAAEKGKLFSEAPKAQHPILTPKCTVAAAAWRFARGRRVAVFAGKAVIINGYMHRSQPVC
jgi:hypothetical protein